ncbi:uncharacterized protein LOC144827417 [Lissotriton helveticus]
MGEGGSLSGVALGQGAPRSGDFGSFAFLGGDDSLQRDDRSISMGGRVSFLPDHSIPRYAVGTGPAVLSSSVVFNTGRLCTPGALNIGGVGSQGTMLEHGRGVGPVSGGVVQGPRGAVPLLTGDTRGPYFMCGSPGWEHFGAAGLAQRSGRKEGAGHEWRSRAPIQPSSSVLAMDNLDCSEDEEVIGGSPVREVPLRSTVRGRSLERGQILSVDSAWRGTEPGLNVVCRNTSTPVQTFSFQDRDRCGGPDLAGRGPVPSRQGEVRRVPSAALSVPPRDPAAASTRGSGVTPLAPTSSRYRWQALPAAKELQSQRTGRYRRVQSAPPPGVSKSFKCTVVDTGLGKTRGDLLHTSVDSVVLDYDEESPEEGEVRDPERGVPSHVSSSVLQAPVVQSQVQGRREHGPSSRAPRRPDALTSETRAEPSRVVSLLPGSVAGPRSSVVTVWIVGHSFVKWARVQAARSYFGDLLGFNDRMFNVLWKGKGGMLWRELIPCLNNNMVGGVCPDILVIHLGENDLCATKGVVLLRAMKRDLGLIKERWAGCHVFWTELIPRRIWRGAVNPRAVDRARKKVNSEVSRCCRSLGFSRISHRDIKFESVEFFRDDGVHLSRVGMELYLLEIREVLARALAMQR